MREVYDFLDDNVMVRTDDTIVVAVSYGPDSMALLDLVKKHYQACKIVCAHVHHNHRKESDDEANSLALHCKKNNILFEMMKINEYHNDTFTEQEARNKRYAFFDVIMKKYQAKYLFMAHHGDDLMETILMRLTRGSTLKGYAGISLISSRNNYKIVRPFLFVTKEELLNYCKRNDISYAVDDSNDSEDYTRNRYRRRVLPFLKRENKNAHRQFLKFSNELLVYDKHVCQEVESVYYSLFDEDKLKIDRLMKNDELIIRKITERFLFENYKDNISKVTGFHVDNIIRMIKSNKPNVSLKLPANKKLIKSYNDLYFDNNISYNDYCYQFQDYTKLPSGYVIERIDKLESSSNYVTALNSKELSLPLYVRNKLDGDKIEVLGLSGSKKIKDIFIDEKVQAQKRPGYPVLVDSDGKVLWLPGVKKSKYDKSKKGKYDIILRYHKEGKDDTAE